MKDQVWGSYSVKKKEIEIGEIKAGIALLQLLLSLEWVFSFLFKLIDSVQIT